ncbi:MAG: hypothetical protein KGK30_03310, partial [Elusimicrobia bacterium]|nr:hypothetical protein [Elusimicrobiota bacterium]
MPSFCFLALAALAAAAQPSVRVITRAGAAPGEAALVVVRGQMAGHPPAGSLAGQPLHFWRGKRGDYLALAGFDLDISTGAHRLKLELRGKGGRLHYWSSEILVKPKAFPVEDVRVDEKYVEPSRAEELRAEAEASGLRRLFARAGPRPLFESRSFRSFRSPIPGALSSRFGERRFFNGVPKAPHSGADLRAKMGVPVKA